MHYFLAKTDPDTYSLEDFKKEGTTIWDGVHNNAALLFMRQMHPGDLVYIYESLSTKAIVGLAEVTSEASENKNDPRKSWVVSMKFMKEYTKPLTLAVIKSEPKLENFALVRQSRLSVMPVPTDIVTVLNKMLSV